MKSKRTYMIFSLALLLAAASGTAWANDEIDSTVTIPAGQPTPIIKNNGVETGTIQLIYTATSCAVGPFAQFSLNLKDVAGTTGTSPTYPITLSLKDDGKGTDAQASPSPNSFSVTGPSGTWSDSSLVTINITSCSNFKDGAPLIANLQESTPSGSHLDTITSVNVHINAVVSSACLNLYSFETNQDTGSLLTSVSVNANKGSVKSTSPGQASVDALVANTCGSQLSFDLQVGLDPQWQTNPSGNPGNATFTYTTAGELDPVTDFSLITSLINSGTGTPQHEVLCLQNVNLAAGDSFLATVHSEIISGIAVSSLPSDGDFDFSATIFAPGSSCGTAYATPSIISPSNPATSTLTYTVK